MLEQCKSLLSEMNGGLVQKEDTIITTNLAVSITILDKNVH